MLLRFRVENFLSFHQQVEFSMVAGKARQHPQQLLENPVLKDVNLLRAAALYGANASGKSNLVRAIDFMRFMVVNGVDPNEAIPRRVFKLNPESLLSPSRFEIEILYNQKVYAYGFALDAQRIHEEWLYEIRPASEKLLFRRTGRADGEDQFEFGIKTTPKTATLLEVFGYGTPKNRLFLQESVERNLTEFKDVYTWFARVLQVIYPETFHKLSQLASDNAQTFKETIAAYLQNLGTGVCGLSLQLLNEPARELPQELLDELARAPEKRGFSIFGSNKQRYFATKTNETLQFYKLTLEHRNAQGELIAFEMFEESDGTARLLDLLPLLMNIQTETQRVVVIDELDRSLHPKLSYQFLQTFLQQSGSQQVIVTTHEEHLLDLDLLRRDEIWFVEKDAGGASNLYSLEEFAPRYDKDIRRGYLLGRFGAIPLFGQPAWAQEA